MKPGMKVEDYGVKDSRGLLLRVSTTGRKAWMYRYRTNGRLERMVLGEYPKLGLADARAEVERQRSIVKEHGSARLFRNANHAAQRRILAAKVATQVLNKLRWLLQQGEVCTLFPEGQRSRTGRIDPATVTYGVGQILRDLERPQVLCAYLRGSRQEHESGVPAYGDVVHLKVEVLEPVTTEQGLRATRDLSRQVINKLKTMEDEFLARQGKPV